MDIYTYTYFLKIIFSMYFKINLGKLHRKQALAPLGANAHQNSRHDTDEPMSKNV